jgi:hypothetical protein
MAAAVDSATMPRFWMMLRAALLRKAERAATRLFWVGWRAGDESQWLRLWSDGAQWVQLPWQMHLLRARNNVPALEKPRAATRAAPKERAMATILTVFTVGVEMT